MVKSLAMRRRKAQELSLNLTPLIDVVFLLLIFFMVTTSFKQIDQLGVELPTAAKQSNDGDLQGVQLVIDQQGAYRVNDLSFGNDLQALQSFMLEQVQAHGSQKLFIVGDKQAPHQSVVAAMSAAQQNGLYQVQILTEQSSKQ